MCSTLGHYLKKSKPSQRSFEKFGDYCKPKKNLTVLRHKFNSRVQSTTESADHSITDLKLLSLDCEYRALRDEIVRDRLVVGVHSEEMKENYYKRVT